MIIQFQDRVTGTPVYINPVFVATFRPDPEDPERSTDVKLQDGESLRILGDHREVASKLATAPV